MDLKSIAPITLAITFSVLVLTIFIAPIITYLFLKRHVVVTIKKEYEISNVQLSLLVFLKKKTSLKDISSLLAEKDVSGFYEYYGISEDELIRIFEKNLELLASNFSLLKDGEEIVRKGEPKDFISSIFIPLPYNPSKILSEIKLVVS